MITFNVLSDEQYKSLRLSLLVLTEGAKYVSYVDTVGIPTIGIGFNLHDSTIFGLVIDAIAPTLTENERTKLFKSLQGTFSSDAVLNSSINKTLASFKDKAAPTSLAFSSADQMLTVLNTAVKKYETRVDNWLPGIPESAERVVLVSLSYNGLINSGTSPTLRGDVVNGNRGDAWYQIRYLSNGGSSESTGIANRRYVESTEFGLYTNSATPSQAEALQVAQEFTDHRQTILAYEETYSPAAAAATKGVAIPDIYAALAPAISTLETQYHILSSSNLKEVQAITDVTSSLTGDEMNNLLIGSGKSDVITDGSGNDFVVGLGGNDAISGGDGVDASVYTGNPIDYDISHNTDGSWTVANVRGSVSDGTDTLKDIDFVQFSDGTKYALQANGILDQTDFAFVIDTTGSMTPYIDGVKANAESLINSIFQNGDTDAHISVISFRDPRAGFPDKVVLPFTTQTNLADRQKAAVAAIDKLGAYGGGDTPEGDNSGLLLALEGDAGEWRDSAAIRRIVLFTDAPVKDTDLQDTVNQYAHDLDVQITTVPVGNSLVTMSDALVTEHAFTVSPRAAKTDASPFQLQIYTIQVGHDRSATASIKKIATDNNGQYFDAPTAKDLIKALTQVIQLPAPASYSIAATDADKAEGDSGTTPFTFTVTRSGDASAASTLTYTVSGSGTSPATADDFTGGAFPTGQVSFAAGDTSKVVTVGVTGDKAVEPDERFTVTLSVASGTLITNGSVTGTILNDDTAVKTTVTATISGNHQTVAADPAVDSYTVTGAFDTLNGDSRPPDIVASGGYNSFNLDYDAVDDAGTPPPSNPETIVLNGPHNTVFTGDQSVEVTGSGAFSAVHLGGSDSSVALTGGHSTVFGSGGSDSISALGGFSSLSFDNGFLGPNGSGFRSTILVDGIKNRLSVGREKAGHGAPVFEIDLSGGEGQGTFDATLAVDATISTGGVYNRFLLSGAKPSDVTTGTGYADVGYSSYYDRTIDRAPGAQRLVLGGTHNSVHGFANELELSGGVGSNSFDLTAAGLRKGTYDIATGGMFNSFRLTGQAHNVVAAGSGYDHVAVTGALTDSGASFSPLDDAVIPGTAITLAGLGNSVVSDAENTSVSGGDGLGTFAFTDVAGDDVRIAGSGNRLTIGSADVPVASTAPIGAFASNGDHAIITVQNVITSLAVQGSGDVLFLGAGAGGTLGGSALPDLHVEVSAGIGDFAIDGIGGDARAIIRLIGGAGGYGSAGQAAAALVSDGHGGALLPVGAGSLDFLGAAPETLHAGLFRIA